MTDYTSRRRRSHSITRCPRRERTVRPNPIHHRRSRRRRHSILARPIQHQHYSRARQLSQDHLLLRRNSRTSPRARGHILPRPRRRLTLQHRCTQRDLPPIQAHRLSPRRHSIHSHPPSLPQRLFERLSRYPLLVLSRIL
jgi:hypothetical protein